MTDQQIKAGDAVPGDIAHVRMRVVAIRHKTVDVEPIAITAFGYGSTVFLEDIAHVEPRPPEPLKVGDQVRDNRGSDIGATTTIIGIHDGVAWLVWDDGRRGEWSLEKLVRA